MKSDTPKFSRWPVYVAAFSLLLLLFTVPHSLEDFSVGEPEKAGIPVQALAFGVAVLIALQGLAIYWTSQRRQGGYVIHAVLGLLWPIAAGLTQLPVILEPGPYRASPLSAIWVIGIIVVGVLLFYCSIQSLMQSLESPRNQKVHQ